VLRGYRCGSARAVVASIGPTGARGAGRFPRRVGAWARPGPGPMHVTGDAAATENPHRQQSRQRPLAVDMVRFFGSKISDIAKVINLVNE